MAKHVKEKIVVTPEMLIVTMFHEKFPVEEIETKSLMAKIKNHQTNKSRIKTPISFYDVYFLGKYISYANHHDRIKSQNEVKDITKAINQSGTFERTQLSNIYTTLSRVQIAEMYDKYPEAYKLAVERAKKLERIAKVVEAKRKLKAHSKANGETPTTYTNKPLHAEVKVKERIDNELDGGKTL